MPKVFVSGCYDLLHSGHVRFFTQAAEYGDLHVALGSDKTIVGLKGRPPVNPEAERLYMVRALRCVAHAFVSSGSGMLDWEKEFREMKPDFLVVAEDGDRPEKRKICEELGVRYVVLPRTPEAGLPARSTTALRGEHAFPYRIDMAGGWLDQPFVAKHHPGAVITFSIEPTHEFNERSGMATSTRKKAIEIWGPRLPAGEPEKLAKILFAYDNPPGTKEVSGSQDAIGLVMPGINFNYYTGKYWPDRIETLRDDQAYEFLERYLHLLPLTPRHSTFSVLADTKISEEGAKALADAAEGCWSAIKARDVQAFGKHTRLSFEAQIAMFPNMVNPDILAQVAEVSKRPGVLGWKLSGAGGGGYLILVSESEVPNTLRVRVRRDNH